MEPAKKRRRAALSPADWERQRQILRNLYLVEKISVKKIVDTMRLVHNFDASKAQYDLQFTKWGFRKNLCEKEWQFIYNTIQSRKGKDTLFYRDNILISNDMINTELPRHVPLSQQCLPYSSSKVPEETPAGMFACTPPANALGTIRVDNLPWFQFERLFHSQAAAPSQSFPVGAIQSIPESFPEAVHSLFSPATPIPSDADDFNINMTGSLPTLEVAVRELSIEELEQKWEMLCCIPEGNNILPFWKFALYLSSNNMLSPYQEDAILQWFIEKGNQLHLSALVSSGLPTAMAFIHKLFKYALSNGHLHIVRTLLRTGIDFSEVFQLSLDVIGISPHRIDFEFVQLCLEAGGDVNLFITMLHDAESVEAAQFLLNAGIDVNELDNTLHWFYSTPVGNAVFKGNFELAEFLIKEGADVNLAKEGDRRTPLRAAVDKGDVEIVKLLLDNKAEVDASSSAWDSYTNCWATPLQVAAVKGDVEVATLLLQSGADVNKSGEQMSALHGAVKCGSIEMVRLLLNHGANPNTPTNDVNRSTAIQMAVENGDTDAYQLLLAAGAISNSSNLCFLKSQLCRAIKDGCIARARVILQSDIDISSPFADQSTILQESILSNDPGMVQLLVEAGADVNIPCRSSWHHTPTVTPLQFALEPICRCDGMLPTNAAEIVKILLGAGANPNSPNGIYGMHSPLSIVTTLSDQTQAYGLAHLLLMAGAFVNEPPSDTRRTALQLGVAHWDKSTGFGFLQLLLDYGANINAGTYSYHGGATPLQQAVKLGNLDLIQLLVDAGANVNASAGDFKNTVLNQALRLEDLDLIRFLVDAGANLNAPAGDAMGGTALQEAVKLSNLDSIRFLLGAGANVNAPAGNGFGCTALQEAVKLGDVYLIQFLLNAGADINAPAGRDGGGPALNQAVKLGDLNLIRYLLDKGADINSPAIHRYEGTALQTAVQIGGSEPRIQAENFLMDQRLKIVKLLIKEGADINASPAVVGGRTALQAAAAATTTTTGKDSFELMQYLLDSGADINAPAGAEKGITALQGAAIRGHMKFALMLLERDADVNAPGSAIDGRTTLEGAAEHGRLDMVQLLINVGADSNLPGRRRYRSAADFAAKEGHFAVAKLLRDRFEE